MTRFGVCEIPVGGGVLVPFAGSENWSMFRLRSRRLSSTFFDSESLPASSSGHEGRRSPEERDPVESHGPSSPGLHSTDNTQEEVED